MSTRTNTSRREEGHSTRHNYTLECSQRSSNDSLAFCDLSACVHRDEGIRPPSFSKWQGQGPPLLRPYPLTPWHNWRVHFDPTHQFLGSRCHIRCGVHDCSNEEQSIQELGRGDRGWVATKPRLNYYENSLHSEASAAEDHAPLLVNDCGDGIV